MCLSQSVQCSVCDLRGAVPPKKLTILADMYAKALRPGRGGPSPALTDIMRKKFFGSYIRLLYFSNKTSVIAPTPSKKTYIFSFFWEGVNNFSYIL